MSAREWRICAALAVALCFSIGRPANAQVQPTVTAASSFPNAAVGGEMVTFSAQVRAAYFGVPTGNVVFMDGPVALSIRPLDASGNATFTTGSLAIGAHNITAIYQGDTSFAGSTSPQFEQTIAAFSLSPSYLSFAALGGNAPAPQTITVNFSTMPGFTASAAVTTPGGGHWLSVAAAGAQTPNDLIVSVDPAGLPPGRYTGIVTVRAGSNPNDQVTAPVMLLVGPDPQSFAPEDVFVGFGGGQMDEFSPAGALLRSLSAGQISTTNRGMAFDSGGNLYSANTEANAIFRFDSLGHLTGQFGGTFDNPQSLVFDSAGNLYVGQDDGRGVVIRLNAAGVLTGTYLVDTEVGGSNWIDLAPDQKTLFYTSGGGSIKRFDLAAGSQLPDFASPGGSLEGVRLLPDGGLLTAQNSYLSGSSVPGVSSPRKAVGSLVGPVVLRLDASGALVNSYPVPAPDPQDRILDIRLDPDGASFWTATAGSAANRVYRIDLATGNVLASFDANGAMSIFGLAVFGEPALNNVAVLTPCPLPSGAIGQPYSQNLSAMGGGGTSTYTWSISGGSLPPGLSIQNAVVTGTPSANGAFTFTLFAASAILPRGTAGSEILVTASKACSMSLGGSTLALSGSCPEAATAGARLSIPLMASGGSGSYHLSYSGPAWLSLSATSGTPVNGQLAISLNGTPPAAGVFDISITLTDSAGSQPAIFQCRIVVNPPPTGTGLSIPACPSGSATVGIPYSQSLSANGGAGTYGWSVASGSLPAGLTLGGSVIAGTPSGPAGSATFVLHVTSGTEFADRTCAISVQSEKLQLTSACPADAAQGAPFGPFVLSASGGGGAASYQYSIVQGQLPAGLQLANGSISGTPVAPPGTYQFGIQVSSRGQASTKNCSMRILGPALHLTGACPAEPLLERSRFSLPLSVSGGSEPYQWTLSGPSWLGLSAAAGAAVVLSGTPDAAGAFPVSVSVTGSGGSPPAVFACTLQVNEQPLRITPNRACPAAPVTANAVPSFMLSASGGSGAYSWSLSGPGWLRLSAAAGISTAISGTPDALGSFPFTVTLNDTAHHAPAAFSCTLNVRAPELPQITVSGLSPTPSLLDPLPLQISLDGPAPLALTGEAVLTFTPDAFGVEDNPRVQFLDPNAIGNGRRLPFTIAAGSQSVPLGDIQQDTVAGTIRVEIVSLRAGEVDVLPNPHPQAQLTIPRSAPVITDVRLENGTATGFDIVISGYSTPRDMSTVILRFLPRSGAEIEGGTEVPVDVAALFREFYGSPGSILGGSTFTGLRIPVQISGDQDAVGGVAVVLVNSAGRSEAATRNR